MLVYVVIQYNSGGEGGSIGGRVGCTTLFRWWEGGSYSGYSVSTVNWCWVIFIGGSMISSKVCQSGGGS